MHKIEMHQIRLWLLAVAFLLVAFGVAAVVAPRLEERQLQMGAADETPVNHWLGNTRKLFASSFFVKADAYFHSGYYPTIYDNRESFQTPHMAEDAGAMEGKNTGDEEHFLGHARDWVDRVNRNMFPSRHTHLDEGGADGHGPDAAQVKEIMPWLKFSAELDPSRVETYLVSAYWLRNRMHKLDDAEQFLREGLRANPGSAAIYYELGQLYREGRKNFVQARNLYLAALERWRKENEGKAEPDRFLAGNIFIALAELEKHEGDLPAAVHYLRQLKTVSPSPADIQKQIDQIQLQISQKL